MTTRDKGITLPIFSPYQQFGSFGYQTTSAANDFTAATAWTYGAGFTSPMNSAPNTAIAPINFTIIGQNAAPSFASVGGNFALFTGVGSVGNSSGNVVLKDTGNNGGGWNNAHYVMGPYHYWFDANGTMRYKAAVPTADQDGLPVGFEAASSGAYDPPSLATGIGATTTIAVASAVLGDHAIASFSLDLQGITVSAYVSAANIVSVRFQNGTAGTIDLAAGTLRVKLIKA